MLSDVDFKPLTDLRADQLDVKYMYYDRKIDPVPCYYVSPPLVTGLTGTDYASKCVWQTIESDLTNITADARAKELRLSGANLGTGELMRIYFGDVNCDDFGTQDAESRFETSHARPRKRSIIPYDLMTSTLYCMEYNNPYLSVRIHEATLGRSVRTNCASVGKGNTYIYNCIKI